jgi:hypothetical protein
MGKSTLVALVALGSTLLATRALSAQDVVTASPFHGGQWGIEAYATSSGGGVMRFLTSRTAIVLSLSATRTNSTQDEPGFGPIKRTFQGFTASLGLRQHRTFAPGMSLTLAGGATAGTSQSVARYPAVPDGAHFRENAYGGYAEVGGQYMPTPHIAVGMAYRLGAAHISNKDLNEGSNQYTLEFSPVRVSLYF